MMIKELLIKFKGPNETKYQYLIRRRENNGLENPEDAKAFTEYSNSMQDVYKNIEEYNPGRKGKLLIVFDDMIFDP